MKILKAIIIATSFAACGPAIAQGANERASMWICTANEGYVCAEKKGCIYIPAEILKIANFDKLEVNDIGSTFKSSISNIRHSESSFSQSATYFEVSYSQIFVIFDDQRSQIGSPLSFPFRMTSANSGNPAVYFGTCSPQT